MAQTPPAPAGSAGNPEEDAAKKKKLFIGIGAGCLVLGIAALILLIGIGGCLWNLGASGHYKAGERFMKEKNYSEAVREFRIAADHGHADAMYELGGCYRDGHGVYKDSDEAERWILKAAEAGSSQAQWFVGMVCLLTPGKADEGIKWLQKSADQGYMEGQFWLASCYADGTGVKRDLSKAKKLYRKAAKQGHVLAKQKLAELE